MHSDAVRWLVLAAALLAAASLGCTTVGGGDGARDGVRVTEAWVFDDYRRANVDSVAVWHGEEWLIATGKETDELLVFGAADGGLLRRVRTDGSVIGALDRPNGIAVIDEWVFVVERNNRRVSVLRLPDLEPLGSFGGDVLRWPYGLAVLDGGDGSYTVYVTDNYETPSEQVPPDEQLGERIRVFSVRVGEGMLGSRLVNSFGDTEGRGVLHKVESIAADRVHGRLLIADELETERNIKVYDLEGRYTGRSLGEGLFRVEVEGIALYPCGDAGYWVATDQSDRISWFRLFERESLEYVGTFVGEETDTTDGIAVTAQGLGPFPEGGLFASHSDAGLAGFDWSEIRTALNLPVCENP